MTVTPCGPALCARTDPRTREAYEFVLREPRLDAPRLIVADRLEELGDEGQAELIRSQIRRANMHRFGGAPWEMHQLLARERELSSTRKNAWIGELPFVASFEFVRGFPGVVCMTPAELVRRGAELFERFPIIGLACYDRDKLEHLWGLEELLDSPWLERLELLRLPGRHDRPERLAQIARVARAANLRIVTPVPTPDTVDSLGLAARWTTPAPDKVDSSPSPSTCEVAFAHAASWDRIGLELANLRVDDAHPCKWPATPRLRLELPRANPRFSPRARRAELPPSVLVVLDLLGSPTPYPIEDERVLEVRGVDAVERERTHARWRHSRDQPGWADLMAIVALAGDRLQVDALPLLEQDFMADQEDTLEGRASGFTKKLGWWATLPHGAAYSAVLLPCWSDAALLRAKRECDTQLTVAFSPRGDETAPAAFDRFARSWEAHGLACDPDNDDPKLVATALSQRLLASLASIVRRRRFESPEVTEGALNLWLDMVTSEEDASKLRWARATVSPEWVLRAQAGLHHRSNGRIIETTAETWLGRHRDM